MATEKQIAYINGYKKEHYKRVSLEMRIAEYDRLKDAADAAGEKVNTYIKGAIHMRIDSESKAES